MCAVDWKPVLLILHIMTVVEDSSPLVLVRFPQQAHSPFTVLLTGN